MKKSIIIIVLLVIIGGVAWVYSKKSPMLESDLASQSAAMDEAAKVDNPTSLTKVSDKISQYKNDELGFSIKYPTPWTAEASPSGVLFTVPTDAGKDPVNGGIKQNTLAKLQVNIDFLSGKCSFPQVTTIKEHDSIKVADATFNMISMSNTVQGRDYFNRMYSLTKGNACYMFNLSAITTNPSNKGYTPTQLAEVTATNKDMVSAADLAFKDLIKSFAFVIGPVGENEALHSGTATSTK